MYKININSKAIDLQGVDKIGLTSTNPFLVYDSVDGKRGNIPKIGWTKNNQEALGFLDMTDIADNSIVRFRCSHEYNGRLLHEGVFVCTKASRKDGFEGTYVENIGEFFGDWQSKLLTECPFEFDAAPTQNAGVWYDGAEPAFVYATIINSDFFGNNQGTYSGKMNDTALATGKTTVKVPLFFASYILTRIEKLTGKQITGSVKTHEALSKLLIFNTREQSGALPVISQHLPDLTIASHLMELYRKWFNQGLVFDTTNGVLDFIFYDLVFETAEIVDWTKKITATEKKVFEQNPRVQISMTLDGADGLMKDKPAYMLDYFSDTNMDKGVFKVQTKYSTLLTDNVTGLAICKQQGVTDTNAQKTNAFAPRALFWNGVVNGIPTATARISGYSLYLNDTNGVPERFWANTIANRAKQYYLEKGVVLDEADIATLDFKKKVYVNGRLYFIVNLPIVLPADTEIVALLVSC